MGYSNKIMADKNAEIKKYESVSPIEQTQQTESNEYNALLAECDKYKLEIQSLHDLQSKMENMNESEIINEQNHKIIALESELNHSKNLNDTQIETIGKFKQLVKEQNEELEKKKNTNIEQMKMNNAIQTELREMKQKNMNQNIQDLDNVFTEMKETENENVSDSNDQNIKRMSNQQIERMSELNMNIELKDNDRQLNIINELKNKNIADSNAQLNGLKNEYKKELTLKLKTNKKISILEQLFRSKLTAVGIDVNGWNNLEEMNQNEIKLLQKKMKKYDEAESVKKQNKLKHELMKAMKQITELKQPNEEVKTLRSQLEDAGNIISDLRQKNDALNDEIIEDLQYSNKIMADKNGEIKVLNDKIKEKDDVINKLHGNIGDINQSKEQDYDEHTQAINTLESKLEAANTKINEYEQQNQRIMAKLADQNNEIIEQKQKINNIESELETAHNQIITINKKRNADVGNLEIALEVMSDEYKERNEHEQILNTEIVNKSNKINKQKQTIKDLKSDIQSIKDSMELIKSQEKFSKNKIDVLQSENKEQRKKIDELDKELKWISMADHIQINKTQKEIINNLETKLKDAMSKMDELEMENKKINDELQEMDLKMENNKRDKHIVYVEKRKSKMKISDGYNPSLSKLPHIEADEVKNEAFGLSAEINQRMAEKYSMSMEKNVVEWINKVIVDENDEDLKVNGGGAENLRSSLKNGVILCELINKIQPQSIKKKIVKSKVGQSGAMANFADKQRINEYSRVAKEMGLEVSSSFEAEDLWDGKNMTAVLVGLHAFGKMCSRNKIENAMGGIK